MGKESQTRKIKTRMMLQPRIGISHPISESSKIFFNYGHFFSSPNWNTLFSVQSVRQLGGIWGSTGFLPMPDLKWPKVVSYEIGYSQSIYNQFLLQISGYYKDYSDELSQTLITNYALDINTTIFDNLVYRDIRGVEFRVERSFGRFINGWANYNYMIRSQGNMGFNNVFQDPTKAEQQFYASGQTRPDITPTFRLNVSLRTPVGWGPGSSILGVKPLAEWRFNVLYSMVDRAKRLMNEDDPPKDWRYINRTPTQMVNIYITKRIARGAQFYVNIQNIFDIKRLENESGNYRDSLHFWYETGEQAGNDKIGERPGYAYLNHPKWMQFYPQKRDIFLGLRYQF